ncbi:hypothetical protein [Micropruina sonneratiae]|uniref:hypothetical protein n=1 Tax=Micropruina sonneratiae TaxID=2986940 RepID=UPI002227AD78|nr:hypothetical protein [Micropruina sp. KQZ13P-5]MCW3157608.1 hypothetical protein [Micropruina sp. KQZ13P-5]
MLVTTGDNVDSAQANELDAYLRAPDGGTIDPTDLGVGHPASPTGGPDPAYWHPQPGSADAWSAKGFPAVSGVVQRAAGPFTSPGVGVPWLSVYGNHDCLVQGRARFPEGYDDFLTGAAKPVLAPPGYTPDADALPSPMAPGTSRGSIGLG